MENKALTVVHDRLPNLKLVEDDPRVTSVFLTSSIADAYSFPSDRCVGSLHDSIDGGRFKLATPYQEANAAKGRRVERDSDELRFQILMNARDWHDRDAELQPHDAGNASMESNSITSFTAIRRSRSSMSMMRTNGYKVGVSAANGLTMSLWTMNPEFLDQRPPRWRWRRLS
jgi:hypothetical protein